MDLIYIGYRCHSICQHAYAVLYRSAYVYATNATLVVYIYVILCDYAFIGASLSMV